MNPFPPNGSPKFLTKSDQQDIESEEPEFEAELKAYTEFIETGGLEQGITSIAMRLQEELKMSPLFSMSTKQAASKKGLGDFKQYALLGHAIHIPFLESVSDMVDTSTGGKNQESTKKTKKIDPVMLNTDTPWSAFICGSQGSGKSHTMSCILENCLLPDRRIGKLDKPLAALVVHYDSMDSSYSEAAHLCSRGIPVRVLVSPSNFKTLKKKYQCIPGAKGNITVEPLYLKGSHLNTERIKRLMAFGDDNDQPPLYLQTLLMILRKMALESQGGSRFSYPRFKERLEAEAFTDKQNGPLKLRLDILESFMESKETASAGFSSNLLIGESGMLTIVDLTDPTIDGNTACVLFDIVLAIFMEKTPCGRIIGLDEAHNYLHRGAASENFTDNLLKAVREQRHRATRVVVATQEPTISPDFLGLCSMIFVHGFNSPDWFSMLKTHVGGARGADEDFQKQGRRFMDEIIELDTGESFLFSKSALLDVKDGVPVKLGAQVRKFRTRQRLTHDGGRSQNATEQVVIDTPASESDEEEEEERETESSTQGGGGGLQLQAPQTKIQTASQMMITKPAPKVLKKKKKVCRYFSKFGNCKRGEDCGFSHE